ncbi:MAG: hypothetical protein ACTJLN_01645 [Rickettsia amblyommatis]
MEFTESLKNIEGFLVKNKHLSRKKLKKSYLQFYKFYVLKIKEWYDIDAPEYAKNILQDITPKFNQTISPTSSQKRLKLSFSKRKDIYGANDDDNN